MWHLINNNLKVFIDPFLFIGLKNLDQRILLINTFQDYFKNIDPSLCRVTFYFPKYVEEGLELRRTFLPGDEVVLIEKPPEPVTVFFPIHADVEPTEVGKVGKMLNEFLTIATQNKCAFYLTSSEFNKEKQIEIEKEYGLKIVNYNELCEKIEIFIQGFYNYFKFNNAIYGIDAPDLAHAMSDQFHRSVLVYLESDINKNQPNEELKERVRSFVHNRYIDLLVTIDRINFFKLQQHIADIERGFVGEKTNNKPQHHGQIRYYLNYYLFLLWGAVDHLAWIVNDIFAFGYSPDNSHGRRSVGLGKDKKDFLEKIKNQNTELYDFIISDDFQEWLFFFGQLRHKNAHREMFSASPLLVQTDESQVTDEEIDKIIYKDEPPIPKDILHLMPPEAVENQKAIDRVNYRISKMKKGVEHFAMISKNGEQFIFNPVGRISKDIETLRELIKKIYTAYKVKISNGNK